METRITMTQQLENGSTKFPPKANMKEPQKQAQFNKKIQNPQSKKNNQYT